MKAAYAIARDLVREAISRKWFLVLGIAITLLLTSLALGLNMEVVDGALAATRLFGDRLDHSIEAADVALRPVFQAASYVIFYGGIAFGIVACSDFGPGLLAPGRIEHLLSLPIPRWSLLAGTLFGVWLVISAALLYGAVGVTLILGFKTGVWTLQLPIAGLLASCSFVAVYGVMLSCSVFVRSAAMSSAVGLILFVGGIVAGYREQAATMFEPGSLWRPVFEAAATFLPPISSIADASASIAASQQVDLALLFRQLAGLVVYGAAALSIAIWRFEQVDY